ncbi:MAG: helix-hairpin-helix domain-containing protein [Pirellulales bacterium]
MNNREIAARFEQIADLLEFQNANPFRIRAYRNGARKIADLSEPLAACVASERLTEIEGIGKDLAAKIESLLTTGSLPLLDQLLAEVPASLLLLIRIPGLGPKKAAVLHRELGIDSLDDLHAACTHGKLQTLKGFGAKTEQKILKGIGLVQRSLERMRWTDADQIATRLLQHMQGVQGCGQMEMAGSYRRGCETVGDLDLLVEAPRGSVEAQQVMDRFASFDQVEETIARGDTKMAVRLDCGLQVDLRVVPQESFGAAWQYFTGSQTHNVELRSRAKRRGLKVNEWGVFRTEEVDANAIDRNPEETKEGGSDGLQTTQASSENAVIPIAGLTEEDVYRAVGLPWFPPELREARQEFAWAEADGAITVGADDDRLPDLITLADLRADLHMHTTATDGKATLVEMVAAARVRGLQYVAITDHSQRVTMAAGLDARRLRSQWEEIDQLNQQFSDLVVLKGIECDILESGGMDLPDDLLAEADWVIASVHYGQNQSQQQITERILGALENPHVHLLAHPTGRLIGRRDRYAVDMEQVFLAAAQHGKMLELNANPARLDLDDIHCAAAKRHGVPVVINTDAHSTHGMEVMRHGVQQARRGGLTPADVANTLSWEKFRELL